MSLPIVSIVTTSLLAVLWGVTPDAALAATPTPAKADIDYEYTIQKGDTPWSITHRFLPNLGMWRRLMVYNVIADERRLTPGAVLRIPLPWLKLTSTSVRLQTMSGKVEVDVGTGWQPANPSQELTKGQRLRTLAQSSATLDLGDSVSTLVRENSELVIDTTGRVLGNGALLLRLELVRGGLESEAHTLRRNGGHFEIETPAAVTSVRGTTFRISADAGFARTEVIEGAVAVSNPHGQVMLPKVTGSRIPVQRQPDPPRALLPSPDLGDLPEEVVNPPLQLPLKALKGAKQYRVQVLSVQAGSAANTPPSIVHESVGERPDLPDLPDGAYVLRTRGIDEVGLEGQNAERKVQVVHRAPPPLPLPPPARIPVWQQVDAGKQLTLAWTSHEAGSLYQVQMFKVHDAASRTLVWDEYVRGMTVHRALPLDGHYVVRVRFAPQMGLEPIWSEERNLVAQNPDTSTVRWPSWLTWLGGRIGSAQ